MMDKEYLEIDLSFMKIRLRQAIDSLECQNEFESQTEAMEFCLYLLRSMEKEFKEKLEKEKPASGKEARMKFDEWLEDEILNKLKIKLYQQSCEYWLSRRFKTFEERVEAENKKFTGADMADDSAVQYQIHMAKREQIEDDLKKLRHKALDCENAHIGNEGCTGLTDYLKGNSY